MSSPHGRYVIAPAMCENTGDWSGRDQKIVGAISLGDRCGLVEFRSEATLLFDPSAAKTAILPNLIISSYFHEMPRPLWLEGVSLVLVTAVFLVPSLCFRFSLRWLDRWWLIASALSFSGSLSNILERAFTGGVRDFLSTAAGGTCAFTAVSSSTNILEILLTCSSALACTQCRSSSWSRASGSSGSGFVEARHRSEGGRRGPSWSPRQFREFG